MNIVEQFKKQFDLAVINGWDKIYVLIDLHGTIFDKDDQFFDGAKKCLYILSQLKGVSLILWTATSKCKIPKILDYFRSCNISFDYVNENPEIHYTDENHDFIAKIYCNVGIDDKFGFDPEEWKELHRYLLRFVL